MFAQSKEKGPSIQVKGVSKTFESAGESFAAVEDVSFSVNDGEFVSLVGPSGCGKSTLLLIIGGLLDLTEGKVVIQGHPVTGPRSDVGIMFQSATLFPWRDVTSNISLPLEIRKEPGPYTAKVDETLELVGLKEFKSHYPHQLSGGMQQRVALCRLLITEPEVMLLDEPFGSLDEITRERLNLELLRISELEGKSTLLVTHSVPEAVLLSDKVIVMGIGPGRILDVLDVPFGRPRDPALLSSSEYVEVVQAVRNQLGS